MNKQMSEHQVVVVTGASAGIGRSAAIEIAARGMGVVITYRSRPDEAQETVSTIQADGGSAVALPLDVGRSETFQAFRSELGRVLLEQWNTDSLYGLAERTPSMLAQTPTFNQKQLPQWSPSLLRCLEL